MNNEWQSLISIASKSGYCKLTMIGSAFSLQVKCLSWELGGVSRLIGFVQLWLREGTAQQEPRGGLGGWAAKAAGRLVSATDISATAQQIGHLLKKTEGIVRISCHFSKERNQRRQQVFRSLKPRTVVILQCNCLNPSQKFESVASAEIAHEADVKRTLGHQDNQENS